MLLLEYEAKHLLQAAGLPTPKGEVIEKARQSNLPLPLVLKSQVPVGGRGKLGGIRIVSTTDEYTKATESLFNFQIKGHTPIHLLAEEKLAIERELYLSLTIDREAGDIKLLAHAAGGIEVEANRSGFLSLSITEEHIPAKQVAEIFDMEERSPDIKRLLRKLILCFIANEATLIEINPLVLTTDGRLICADAKIELDDAAAFRHDWHFEATQIEANFVTIDLKGTVATIANGAGLAMATVDAVYDHGMLPANFLDIGGGATTASVMTAFERIVAYPNVRAIIINIFAGITKCDEVAKAVIEAKGRFPDLPPLFIRLAGTNYDAAANLLADTNIPLHNTLEACLQSASKEISS